MVSNPIPIEEAVYIYGLRDPITRRLRYIGQSAHPTGRLAGHLGKDSMRYGSAKNRWLQELLDSGLKPEVCILEVGQRSEADALEEKWIGYFLARDEPLLNVRGCDLRNGSVKASRTGKAPQEPSSGQTVTDDMMTVAEAAAYKGTTQDGVRRKILRGRLPAVKKADVWFVARADLDKWQPQRRAARARRAEQQEEQA